MRIPYAFTCMYFYCITSAYCAFVLMCIQYNIQCASMHSYCILSHSPSICIHTLHAFVTNCTQPHLQCLYILVIACGIRVHSDSHVIVLHLNAFKVRSHSFAFIHQRSNRCEMCCCFNADGQVPRRAACHMNSRKQSFLKIDQRPE